jgi:hypothetical protein
MASRRAANEPTDDRPPDFYEDAIVASFDVTETEAAILRVVANPSMMRKSAREKAAAAGVSRATWFRYHSDAEFQEKAIRCFRAILRSDIARVIAALADSASNPNPRSCNDRKLFFELVGMYPPPPPRSAAADSGNVEPAPYSMTDEELLRVFLERGLTLPPTIRHRLIAAGKLPPDSIHG